MPKLNIDNLILYHKRKGGKPIKVNEIHLHAGIHTLYIIGNIPETDIKIKGVTMERIIFDKNTGEMLQGARVNPNKFLFDDKEYLTGYRQFMNTVDTMLLERGITEYGIQRIDFRIDNYNNTFDELYKLNNILINLLSMALGVDNCYKSLKNDIPHNIVARGKRKEVECYNRIAKDGNGLTKTRIELRRKFPLFQPIPKTDIQSIYNEWVTCFKSKLMSIYYRQFQAVQNNRIVQSYKQSQRTQNIIDLISKNQDYICTSRQMKELCNMLNLAKDVAYTYKNRLQIEYYKYADIEAYLNNIITELGRFLMS